MVFITTTLSANNSLTSITTSSTCPAFVEFYVYAELQKKLYNTILDNSLTTSK
ncbi:hypothetical protein DOY81_004068 [Sarcophaga bullata]|nr:hypothetical protein DOY81_004068 [Sarcophaga bullata]